MPFSSRITLVISQPSSSRGKGPCHRFARIATLAMEIDCVLFLHNNQRITVFEFGPFKCEVHLADDIRRNNSVDVYKRQLLGNIVGRHQRLLDGQLFLLVFLLIVVTKRLNVFLALQTCFAEITPFEIKLMDGGTIYKPQDIKAKLISVKW